jgi:hypothetical protein
VTEYDSLFSTAMAEKGPSLIEVILPGYQGNAP